jgi:hypothetical protein
MQTLDCSRLRRCAAQEFHKVLKLAESLPFVTKSGGISLSILVMQTAEY